MTNGKILVVYKSVTGFTREYAEMIGQEIDCTLMDVKEVTAGAMSDFDTVVFGGRLHAGTVDGFKRVKELFQQSKASQLMVYAVGAMPSETETKDIIDEMWGNNLSPAELLSIPHFYVQGGLRYEKMPLPDKLMMKAFSAMMRKKKDKSEYEKLAAKTMASSYDSSSREYIAPLVAVLRDGDGENKLRC